MLIRFLAAICAMLAHCVPAGATSAVYLAAEARGAMIDGAFFGGHWHVVSQEAAPPGVATGASRRDRYLGAIENPTTGGTVCGNPQGSYALAFEWVGPSGASGGINPSSGCFDWRAADKGFAALAANKMQLMVGIVHFPTWASGVAYNSIPSSQSYLQDFVDGMFARASLAGAKIHAFEGANEYNNGWNCAAPCSSYNFFYQGTTAELITFSNWLYAAIQGRALVYGSPANSLNRSEAYQALYGSGTHINVDVITSHAYIFPAVQGQPAVWNTTTAVIDPLNTFKSWFAANGYAGKPIAITEYSIDDGLSTTMVDKGIYILQATTLFAALGVKEVHPYQWNTSDPLNGMCTDGGSGLCAATPNAAGKGYLRAIEWLSTAVRKSFKIIDDGTFTRVEYDLANMNSRRAVVWKNQSDAAASSYTLPLWAKSCTDIDAVEAACSGATNIGPSPVLLKP